MTALPTLFISHGAPDLVLTPLPARDFLRTWGEHFPRPRAIVVASAHWEDSDVVKVSTVESPRTIHDFGGFDPRLREMHYRAPGAPALAARVLALLGEAGVPAAADTTWGLDHGAWVPLMLMYPEADIPVIQVSVNGQGTPAVHFALGRALAALRTEGVLVIGSGALTHALHAVAPPAYNTAAPVCVHRFDDWVEDCLARHDEAALLDSLAQAPALTENHPSLEHYLPLFVALGAAGPEWRAEVCHQSVSYRILRMDMLAFH
jgi:4,5-DOPA dioxygenase extradiol